MARRHLLLILIAVTAVAVRCWQIDAPFFDSWSWRQSDVAAIARNYFENGFRFAHPQIDWAGNEAGFVGTEFPLLPFAAALAYKLLGVHEWIGRALTVFFFALSLPIFFALVRRASGETAAIFALIFYSFAPLSIAAGRAFIPDFPSLTLSLAALYFFWRWLEPDVAPSVLPAALPTGAEKSYLGSPVIPSAAEGSRLVNLKHPEQGKAAWFLLAAVALALSLLLKITSAVVGAALFPLAFAALRAKISLTKPADPGHPQESPPTSPLTEHPQPSAKHAIRDSRIAPRSILYFFGALVFFALLTLAPSGLWYWHAHQIAAQFYPHHFFGAGGVQLMDFAWYRHIAWLTFTSSLTPVLFLLAVVGLFVARGNRALAPFRWWLGSMVVFIIVVGYGNRHPWYQLPLVPIAAAFAGCAADFIARKSKSAAVAIVILFLVSSGFYLPRFFAPRSRPLYDLGLELKALTPASALVIVADDGDPTALYYGHRKGWHFLERDGIYDGNPSNSAQLIRDLEILRARGATHLAFPSSTRWWLDYYPEFTAQLTNSALLLPATSDCRIYQLKK